ncbi:type IV pilus twitching motility protein PilT [Patescibacteria group bacterium]|nr:type IV pilus twitching motility protein PilT [Patescibacteria group bacterium]
MAASPSAKKIIDDLLIEAAENRASDLHLLADEPPVFRIDGLLKRKDKAKPLSAKEILEIITSMITREQLAIYEKERELDFGYEIKDKARYRVNIHWELGEAGLVARVIPLDIPTMEELQMPEIVYNLMHMNQGLVLVTGPTGSGKSTSLAAMIDLINSERSLHIVTLEDPVEFIYTPKKALIMQRQLGTDFLSFAEGLKRVVRQDPDVILVGEMRDLETIAAALTLAETGHLVLATLHTNSAAQTIDRIIDVFPPFQQPQIKMQLSMELRSVISQQLLPKPDGGRVAAREILLNNDAVANLIRENKVPQISSVMQTGSKQGMVTMDQDLKRLIDAGFIDKETAEAYSSRPVSKK